MELINKPKVILVGCGAVSRFFYAPALKCLADSGMLEVKNLIDPISENMKYISKTFPNIKNSIDMQAVEITKDCLVIVASPPQFHAQQSIYALQRGASVLCEKPMATSCAEAESMVKSASENNAMLAVGLYMRFFPSSKMIKEIIESNTLGKLRYYSIKVGGKYMWQAQSDSFFRKSMTPGGVLYDVGVHVLDLLLWWLGDPCSVAYEDDAMGGLEANCKIIIKYSSGIDGLVQLSRDWETPNRYTFQFEKGIVNWYMGAANHLDIKLDGVSDIISGDIKHSLHRNGSFDKGLLQNSNSQSFMAQIINIIESSRDKAKLLVSGSDGLKSLQLIERCYGRRRLMQIPWFSKEESMRARILANTKQD